MCGIAGFVDQEPRSLGERRALLKRMLASLRHRGPDDEGALIADRATIGMRRLAIIDRAGGQQPIASEDGSAAVVFNGEIYNFRELRAELEAQGHIFRTRTDTEVIVHAYEQHGARCVDGLRGMFAFAIWDAGARRLLLARDRAGEKPLYYSLTPRKSLVFGSELKAVLQHPEVSREISFEAIDRYLSFGYVPDPLSIYRNIFKLPPGHLLSFRDGAAAVQPYWDYPFEKGAARSEGDCREELRALLEEAVRIRLVAEVPVGAFLSGGIDSSTVVGLMSRFAGAPVKTFSIGFHEDSYDELKHARAVAREFGTEHEEFIVTPEVCHVVDELVRQFDEPFADSSAIPTYMVSRLARGKVTVALSGDGGDELFAGYTRYVVDRRRSGYARLPRWVRRHGVEAVARRLPHGAWGRNYLHNIALDPIDRYLDSISIFNTVAKQQLYTGEFQKQLAGAGAAGAELAATAAAKTDDPLHRLLYIDSKSYLPGDILTKVDRTTMAVSLEARAPLLDHKLIECVSRMPASMKLRGLETKYLLKQAVRDLVPDRILERPKQGFGIPMQQWVNQELRERIRGTLTEARTRQRGYFEPRHVDLLLDEHERGRRDHSASLWALMMLELWQRTFVDAGGAACEGVYALSG